MSNTLNNFLAQIANSTLQKNVDLTEIELIQENPVIGYAAAFLFLIGVFIDVNLISTLVRGGRLTDTIRSRLSKVLPWDLNYRELGRIFAVVILTVLTGSMLAALAGGREAIDDGAATSLILSVEMVFRLGLFAWLLWWVGKKGMSWQRMIGSLNRTSICRALGKGIVAFFAVLPPLTVVLVLYSTLAEMFGWDQSPQPIVEWFLNADSVGFRVLLACLAIVVAPVFEEVLFRGIAYPVLKNYLGMGKAMLIVSVMFAAIHFHVGSLMPLFVLAIGFNLAYEHTGSLLTPILMHSVFNAMNVAALAYRSGL